MFLCKSYIFASINFFILAVQKDLNNFDTLSDILSPNKHDNKVRDDTKAIIKHHKAILRFDKRQLIVISLRSDLAAGTLYLYNTRPVPDYVRVQWRSRAARLICLTSFFIIYFVRQRKNSENDTE